MKHLNFSECSILPHKEQRYNTAGDYLTQDGIDIYLISKLPQGWKAEFAVLVHEMVEYNLCKEAGIKELTITKFDLESGHPDPGTLKEAPYFEQHRIATKIEKYIIKQLGLDWKQYDLDFEKLKYKKNA